MNKFQRTSVELAIRRLEALCNTADDRCSVPELAKQAINPYVTTWVIPVLRKALSKRAYRGDVDKIVRELEDYK